ncbi:hypothetical protein C0033_09495 [Clostridium sp. chh4-2]|uniref:DUF4176 domain-containing protein n=1 Tax=Clostridium sp. chh4-2 TaxID=2067550 RepID=UPI000CCE7076|nr:DUF4176 domain-containing protein [Clostridium sp. chh4-2]PNV62332.1 hypothetical protein C0033_09495 [Clostridium sp. chh4-2]
MSQKNYLPIGSVVLLKEGKKRLMIYGRRQLVKDGEKEYDYSACLYPEGMLNSKDVVLFNHDQIQMIYFIGFQDIEELHFRSLLKNSDE